MVKILVFDTETNDLPPVLPGKNWEDREEYGKKLLKFSEFKKKKSIWDQYIGEWPSILQLSYILYDTESPEQSIFFNKYIDIIDEIQISESSRKIHHITKEKIADTLSVNKAKIYDVLNEFMSDVEKADIIVGHNVQFDRKMIIAELIRLSKEKHLFQIKEMMNNKHFECTMNKTKEICKLQIHYDYIDKKTGKKKIFSKLKSPKLIEAYKHFFGYQPDVTALHDAMIDTVICLRVYCMTLKKGFDVCGTNPIITDYIKRISPADYMCWNLNNLDSLNNLDQNSIVNVKHRNINKSKSKSKNKNNNTKKRKNYSI